VWLIIYDLGTLPNMSLKYTRDIGLLRCKKLRKTLGLKDDEIESDEAAYRITGQISGMLFVYVVAVKMMLTLMLKEHHS
jgi:hypothetical protein